MKALAHPTRARFLRHRLAEEVVFLHRGEAGMRIAAADEAELVWVRAELPLELQAVLEAERAYSNSSISFFFATLPSRLPLSQISKSANSSFGDRNGCVSPVPLVCVVS